MENIKFKIGNSYYYKNQYMDDAMKLQLIDKQEWTNGEIDSLEFKKPDGSRFTLKKYDIKYITQNYIGVDGYSFEKQFSSFIQKEISESPKQIFGIVKSIDKKESKGIATVTFTEEIKDGRTSKFAKSTPLKLKGKRFSYKGIILKVTDIKFIGENKQPSDYNEYVDSNYSMEYAIEYSDKMNEGGSIKSKGTFYSFGSAIELGITPKIEGHDMIAKCDCGEKFSYQNSKKNILWQCPECKGMKRIKTS
jgi:hypothetical protein